MQFRAIEMWYSKRPFRPSTLGILILAVTLASCTGGDGNGAAVVDVGEGDAASTDTSTRTDGSSANSGVRTLQGRPDLAVPLPASPQKQGAPVALQLESTGPSPLTIESLELVQTPDRLLFRGEKRPSDCQYDENQTSPPWNAANDSCRPEEFCDDATTTCYEATLPDNPGTIPSDASVEYEFFVAAAPRSPLDCPAPSEEVPSEFADDYCGRLEIESDASTDNAIFSDGDATFYFQADGHTSSGAIGIQPASLSLEGLQPGTSKRSQFQVLNNGSSPLTIETISVSNLQDLVTVEANDGQPTPPFEIAAGSSVTFEFAIAIPDDYDTSNLPAQIFVAIENSSTSTAETLVVELSS